VVRVACAIGAEVGERMGTRRSLAVNGQRCREPIVFVVVRTLLSLDSTRCWMVVWIGQPDGEAGASAWLLAGRREA